jgi:hypothetical protein
MNAANPAVAASRALSDQVSPGPQVGGDEERNVEARFAAAIPASDLEVDQGGYGGTVRQAGPICRLSAMPRAEVLLVRSVTTISAVRTSVENSGIRWAAI